jgi:hypothetical protein
MNLDHLYPRIRLSKLEIDTIVAAFTSTFLPGDSLWIFGSRVDLAAKGGDIDLYLETNNTDAGDVLNRKLKMVSEIWHKIGERKIDVVLNMLGHNQDLAIYKVAKEHGIKIL